MASVLGKIPFNYDTFNTSFKVVLEMMEDRCYSSFENPLANKEDFNERIESLGYIAVDTAHCNFGHKCLIVWFPLVDKDNNLKKLNVKYIVDLRNIGKTGGKDEILIITDRTITINALKIIESEKDFFEIRKFIETQFNVTKHELVPQHRALERSETMEMIKLYGTLDKFPKILTTDPIIRYYKWKSGMVIEIVRNNYNGPEIFYRVVSKG